MGAAASRDIHSVHHVGVDLASEPRGRTMTAIPAESQKFAKNRQRTSSVPSPVQQSFGAIPTTYEVKQLMRLKSTPPAVSVEARKSSLGSREIADNEDNHEPEDMFARLESIEADVFRVERRMSLDQASEEESYVSHPRLYKKRSSTLTDSSASGSPKSMRLVKKRSLPPSPQDTVAEVEPRLYRKRSETLPAHRTLTSQLSCSSDDSGIDATTKSRRGADNTRDDEHSESSSSPDEQQGDGGKTTEKKMKKKSLVKKLSRARSRSLGFLFGGSFCWYIGRNSERSCSRVKVHV